MLLGHLCRKSWAPFRSICAICETPLWSTACPGLTNRLTRENSRPLLCVLLCLWLTQTLPSQGIGLASRLGWFPAAHVDSGSSDGKAQFPVTEDCHGSASYDPLTSSVPQTLTRGCIAALSPTSESWAFLNNRLCTVVQNILESWVKCFPFFW